MSLSSKLDNTLSLIRTERPIFGVDLDNVLALTDPLIRRLIKEMFGVRLEQRDLVHFDYWRCGITKKQEQLVFARFYKTECAIVSSVNEAVDALQYLHNRFEIHIITGRPPKTKRLTMSWLKKYNIPYDELDFLQHKNESRVSFKAFVDDHRETAYDMAGRGVHSFLLDYPWNQPESVDPPNLIRVKSWKAIRRYLESL